MHWSVPRELLWAIIGALTIFFIALWPPHYPYNQVTKINPQHQTENGVSGGAPADNGTAAQIDPSGKQQHEYSRENTYETTVLGIKPGEWLLSIVTLMLWGATVSLVRGSDRTAERQLRAYVFVKNGRIDRRDKSILRANLTLENGGQTPAHDLVYKGRTFIVPPENTEDLGPFSEDIVIIGPRAESQIYISGRIPLTIENQHAY